MLEALESGRAYSSLSLSSGGTQEDGEELDPLESIGSEEHQYEVSEDRAVLAPGFRVLDERERKILHLRFFEGLTQSQIAQQIGISQMHVSRLIRRSLEKIRDEIAAEERPHAAARSAPRTGAGPGHVRPSAASARGGGLQLSDRRRRSSRVPRTAARERSPPYNRPVRTSAEIREGFLSFFESKGHLRQPVGVADPARGRPLDAADQRGDAAADAVLPRARAAAGRC